MVVGQFSQDVDILVIGGGPSGYTAAFRSAELGKTVAIVEPNATLGGECLHSSCIPSKAALFGKTIEERTNSIESLAKGLDQRCASLGIERLCGLAHFENSKTVQITGETVSIVRFRKAIIATGSSKRRHDDFQTPVHQVEEVYGDFPASGNILLVGDNANAVEAATYLGQTHNITLQVEGVLLPEFDSLLVKFVERDLSKFITICNQHDLDASEFDAVVLSGNRPPNIEMLHLDKAEIMFSSDGITINNSCQTSNPKIYAVGECAGRNAGAAVGIMQGRIAAEHACGRDAAIDASFTPKVVWSNPQLAQCGMLSGSAAKVGLQHQTASTRWGNSGLAVALGCHHGITTITFDPHTQAILGVGIAGQGAAELISEGVLALEMGATLYDLATTVHPHPSISELLSETAQAALSTLL